jgi:class 3 adenylate cyclase
MTGLAMQDPPPIAAATIRAAIRDSVVPSAGERRRLTVLFADLVGSTVLGREMESELFSELLVRLREIWHQSVARHGGRVIRTQGDGVLALFGYPHSGEDDGRRAAEAALDIQEAVGKLRQDGIPSALLPFRMHSGIHAGTLLLAEGDIECGRFDLIGDVVNTAAHMSQRAAPGEILVSLDALGPHANFFELGPDPLETGPGSAMPRLRAVLGRSSVTRRFESTARRGLTPFIGRDEVLASLLEFLTRPDFAPSRCVVVVGGAGLGKTRLLEELLQRCEGGAITLLHGSCESYVSAEVLQPFLQMLRAFFGIQAGIPKDEAARAIRAHWHPSLTDTYCLRVETIVGLIVGGAEARGDQIAPGDMVGDLLAFLSALSGMVPSVLVIDDWQWADDATRQLLEALLRLPGGPRVILASRPRDDGAGWISGAPHLALAPFQGSETDLAIRRWLPQADPFLIARIHSYAGGVPLFIEELCHSASADHLAAAIEGRGSQGWLACQPGRRGARRGRDRQFGAARAAGLSLR